MQLKGSLLSGLPYVLFKKQILGSLHRAPTLCLIDETARAQNLEIYFVPNVILLPKPRTPYLLTRQRGYKKVMTRWKLHFRSWTRYIWRVYIG